MQIALPSEGELRELLSEHAHRHPSKAAVTVIGDGGKPVRLPFLLGNPSGCSTMPDGARVSPAWSAMLGAALGIRTEPPGLAMQLAEDCLIYPDRGTFAQWAQRWPGLPKALAGSIERKVGAVAGLLVEPEIDEDAPPALVGALRAIPHAVWRKLGDPVGGAVVVEPPSSAAWRLFVEAIGKPKADVWTAARGMALGCLRAVSGHESPDVLIEMWPGVAVFVVGEIGRLVGASAEVELGGW